MKIRWILGLQKGTIYIYVNVAIKDKIVKETDDLHQCVDNYFGQRAKISSSTFIKAITKSYILNETDMIKINNVRSHENLTVTTTYKQNLC